MILRPDRLVVVGSVIVDVLVRVPRLPTAGGDVIAMGASRAVGGGYNALIAASRLGFEVALAGLVGDGPNGELVKAALDEAGIERLLPSHLTEDTGSCIALTVPNGKPTYVSMPGAETRLLPEALGRYIPGSCDAVYVSGYDLLSTIGGPTIAVWIAEHEPWLVLDPGPLVEEIPESRLAGVLARTHVLTLNRHELAKLAGATPDGDLTAVLDRLAPDAHILARSGADGAWLHNRDGVRHIEPYPVAAVDTTAAGDTHTGAFVAALGEGMSMVRAAQRANVAAALATTRPGAPTGPTLAEVLAHE